MKKNITTKIFTYTSTIFLSDKEKQLVEAAKKATRNAYAPYSKLKVGAAVLLKSGKIYPGNNQENAAFPSGICAEQVALSYANANHPEIAVAVIAITALKNEIFLAVSPCGKCRQVMLESEKRFKSPMKVILYSDTKQYVITNAQSLLPLHFGIKGLT